MDLPDTMPGIWDDCSSRIQPHMRQIKLDLNRTRFFRKNWDGYPGKVPGMSCKTCLRLKKRLGQHSCEMRELL